jgi:hypothetical protein
MRTAKAGLGRGVYVAPWLGDDDELVLMGITTKGRLVCAPVVVPNGASRLAASDAIWEVLDELDPIPRLHLLNII